MLILGQSLERGKNKVKIDPEEYLKFMVLLDRREVREATKRFLNNMEKKKCIAYQCDVSKRDTKKVYVVFIKLEEDEKAV